MTETAKKNARKFKNMLVTGGAGFIGSAFVRCTLHDKAFDGKIINLDLLTYAGNKKNLALVQDDPRHIFVQGNISDANLVEELCDKHEIDAIVHFAAESHVDRSISSPLPFIQTNIIGTFTLLEAVRKRPHIHFHHVSTDEVYGDLGSTGKFSEDSPYKPSSPYSASKASSDHIVRSYVRTYGILATISNCSNNYGPYQYPEKLIPLMILNCAAKKPLPVYGTGGNIRDWLYVEDHVEGIWTLLRRGKNGDTYNIGGEAEWTNLNVVKFIVQEVAEQTGQRLKELESLITFVPDRPGHDFRYAIDCSKIQRELGWKPRHTFETGLRDTVRWYLNL